MATFQEKVLNLLADQMGVSGVLSWLWRNYPDDMLQWTALEDADVDLREKACPKCGQEFVHVGLEVAVGKTLKCLHCGVHIQGGGR